MTATVTRDVVWRHIEQNTFAVLGWVNDRCEPRSTGIVYTVHEHELYIAADVESWKARHIARNPAVSVTVTIPKRVPFMPWFKVPAAVASFAGEAKIHERIEFPPHVIAPLFTNHKTTPEIVRRTRIIRVVPHGHIVTYGIGVKLLAMRDPAKATARVPV